MAKAKTRKVYHSTSERCCDATFHGLHIWYVSKFEKLGWMILAKEKGMNDKVQEYIHSLHRLHTAIHQKIQIIHDKDKKSDLQIMKKNVEVLLAHVKRDF
jgi:hypothetical protein